ncbi:hypothetical protein JNW90_29340 [Micromonospora sp. STR1s_5]|nr:hypothetical protein [Micromonospora sp. STR1s_5]
MADRRDNHRQRSEPELVAADIERVRHLLDGMARRLVGWETNRPPASDLPPLHPWDWMGEALRTVNGVKGRMYLARQSAGLYAGDLSAGSGWSADTLRQFEMRETDTYASSLFRYANGLRQAGIRGRIELRWVPGEDPR